MCTSGGALRGKAHRQIRSLGGRIGDREVDDEAQAVQEGLIQVLLQFRGQNGVASVDFHSVQQVGHLHIRETLVRVDLLDPLSEQRVGLIEKQDGAGPLGCIENAAQALHRLADVLGVCLRDIDLKTLDVEIGSHNLCCHGLATTARAGEESGRSPAVDHTLRLVPVVGCWGGWNRWRNRRRAIRPSCQSAGASLARPSRPPTPIFRSWCRCLCRRAGQTPIGRARLRKN